MGIHWPLTLTDIFSQATQPLQTIVTARDLPGPGPPAETQTEPGIDRDRDPLDFLFDSVAVGSAAVGCVASEKHLQHQPQDGLKAANFGRSESWPGPGPSDSDLGLQQLELTSMALEDAIREDVRQCAFASV